MDAVNEFATALSLGETLMALIDPPDTGPTWSQMEAMLDRDMTNIFATIVADQSRFDAMTKAQEMRDWLAHDYQQDAEKLDLQRDARLKDLEDAAKDMQLWAEAFPGPIAYQSLSVALTCYTLIVSVYKELAANPAKPENAPKDLITMAGRAKDAAAGLFPLYEAVRTARLQAVTWRSASQFSSLAYDSWVLPDGSVLFEDFPGPEFGGAYDAYKKLLQTGTQPDADTLKAKLTAGDFADAPSFAAMAQATIARIPALQKTGSWLNSAPSAIQALRNIADVCDYAIAFNGQAGLSYASSDGRRDLPLGVVDSPSVAKAAPLYVAAFAATGGQPTLCSADSTGYNDRLDYVGVAAGSTPVVAASPGGGHAIYYARTDGTLCVWTDQCRAVPTEPQVKPGTSPSVASLAGHEGQVTFHHANGNAWMFAGGDAPHDLELGMDDLSSPAIAVVSDDSYWIAMQRYMDGSVGTLWTAVDGHAWDSGLPMARDTSPCIVVTPDDRLVIAFQHSSGHLWTANGFHDTPAGFVANDWGHAMASGTSPSISALPINGFVVAFHSDTGELIATQIAFTPGTHTLVEVGVGDNGTAVPKNWGQIYDNTSPSVTGLDFAVATAA